jgi:DNA-binding CsgD family transcriptional regulator
MNANELYKSVLKEYGINLKTVNFEKIESVLDVLSNEFSRNENSLKVIFDNNYFKLLDISDNVEAMSGYTKEEIYAKNILVFFNSIDTNHAQFPVELVRWNTHIWNYLSSTPSYSAYKSCIGGIKVQKKDGKNLRILIRYVPIEFNENGTPKFGIISIDDITHLFKGDFYWFRMDFNNQKTMQFHMFSNDKKYHTKDIISEREKAVLRLAAEGLESKEIGEKLFISINTVDNHRRNMIARTGAKDTTALVQLCRMCDII